MKILTIGNFTTGWDGSICDEEHIAKALEALGHEVVRVQRETTKGFATEVHPWEGKYDFALIAQWDGYGLGLFTVLEDYRVPVVYWAFDYQEDGQEWHDDLISVADLYLSKPISDSKYPNWQWLPQDFAPDFLDPVFDWQTVEYSKKPEKQFDVVFTGSCLPYAPERTQLLLAAQEKFDLHVFSVTQDAWTAAGIKNSHPAVMDHGLPELIGRTKINLSIDWKLAPGYWSDRNSQIISCGGFVLFRYVPLSEMVFDDDVAYFYNEADMLEKIQYYLDHDQERDAIQHGAVSQANRIRKVDYRVRQLLTIVGGIL